MGDAGHNGASRQDNNFTMTGSQAVSDVDVGIRELMLLCLRENDRRFAGYDARLRRPTTMPGLVRVFLWLTGWWPPISLPRRS
jgi:hypothetical protein